MQQLLLSGLLMITVLVVFVLLPAAIGYMVGGSASTAWATAVSALMIGVVWELVTKHKE